jgi:ribosomal protein S8
VCYYVIDEYYINICQILFKQNYILCQNISQTIKLILFPTNHLPSIDTLKEISKNERKIYSNYLILYLTIIDKLIKVYFDYYNILSNSIKNVLYDKSSLGGYVQVGMTENELMRDKAIDIMQQMDIDLFSVGNYVRINYICTKY